MLKFPSDDDDSIQMKWSSIYMCPTRSNYAYKPLNIIKMGKIHPLVVSRPSSFTKYELAIQVQVENDDIMLM